MDSFYFRTSVMDPDPHHFGNLDPHSASNKNLDPDPHRDSHQSDKLDPDLDTHQFADDKPKCIEIAYFSTFSRV
jgi:hypothetical protein